MDQKDETASVETGRFDKKEGPKWRIVVPLAAVALADIAAALGLLPVGLPGALRAVLLALGL